MVEEYKGIKYEIVDDDNVEYPCEQCEMKHYCDDCLQTELYMLCHSEFNSKRCYCKIIQNSLTEK